jgi:hypothetical protein
MAPGRTAALKLLNQQTGGNVMAFEEVARQARILFAQVLMLARVPCAGQKERHSLTTGLFHVNSGWAAYSANDFENAATLADQTLELALRAGNPTNLALAYRLQVMVRLRSAI